MAELKSSTTAYARISNRETDINILLLGETGTGKSTFINATYSYLRNETIEEAIEDNFRVLIPFKFAYQGMDDKDHIIFGGRPDESEHIGIEGGSSTQSCRSYVFEIENKVFRIIDTPGIGNTHGYERDIINFQLISTYISKFTHLNAVCFVMKPNSTFINTQLKYCFNELLKHLNRSVRNNVTFIFTNARQSFFRPGDVHPIIKQLLKEQREKNNLSLDLNNENSFFFDNEGFRFLALKNQGISLDEEATKSFQNSWAKTKKEYTRLIEYFAGRPSCAMQGVIDLIDAERVLRKLPRPIANIYQMIEENIALGEKFNQHVVNQSPEAQKGLEQQREVISGLPHPRTVCSGDQCSKLIEKNGEKQIEFTKICHDACYIHSPGSELIGEGQMQECESMNGRNFRCKTCGCSWKKHLHITYEYKTVTEFFKSLKDVDKRISDLRRELSRIQEIHEKLNIFLISNSLAPINSSIVDYLDYFIQNKKAARTTNHSATLDRLQRLKNELSENYEKMKETANKMKENPQSITVPDQSEVTRLLEELYSLPINGGMIRQQMSDFGNFKFPTAFPEIVVELPEKSKTNTTVKPILTPRLSEKK